MFKPGDYICNKSCGCLGKVESVDKSTNTMQVRLIEAVGKCSVANVGFVFTEKCKAWSLDALNLVPLEV